MQCAMCSVLCAVCSVLSTMPCHVGPPGHGGDGLSMAHELAQEEAAGGIPQVDSEVVAARQQPLVVQAPSHVRHTICSPRVSQPLACLPLVCLVCLVCLACLARAGQQGRQQQQQHAGHDAGHRVSRRLCRRGYTCDTSKVDAHGTGSVGDSVGEGQYRGLHYRLLTLCSGAYSPCAPGPTDPVGQIWPRGTGSVGDSVGEGGMPWWRLPEWPLRWCLMAGGRPEAREEKDQMITVVSLLPDARYPPQCENSMCHTSSE